MPAFLVEAAASSFLYYTSYQFRSRVTPTLTELSATSHLAMMMSPVTRPCPLALITNQNTLPEAGSSSRYRDRSISSPLSLKINGQKLASPYIKTPKSSAMDFTLPASPQSSRLVTALRELNGLGAPVSPEAVRDLRFASPTAAPRMATKTASPRTPTKKPQRHLAPISFKRVQSSATQKSVVATIKQKERISLRIPQSLPAPQLQPNSSPHDDLVGHLFRHNFLQEAREAHDTTMPAAYMLDAYLRLGQSDSSDMLKQSQQFLNQHQLEISKCLRPGAATPTSVSIDISEDLLHPIPTHLLAVYASDEVSTIFAVHGLVLSLQCISIPFFSQSTTMLVDGKQVRNFPLMGLCIPHPKHFAAMLRWFYTQSTTTLFQGLLPLQHIVRYLTLRTLKNKAQSRKVTSRLIDVSSYSTSDLAEALSVLPTKTLLAVLQKIQAFWKNGVALGVFATNFWAQLDKSWELVISAMVMAKKQRKSSDPSLITDASHS